MSMWDEIARPKGSDAPSWEYYIKRFPADTPAEDEMFRDVKLLNAIGAQGWELANIYRLPKSVGGWRKEWGDALVFCIFKRPVTKTTDLTEEEEDEQFLRELGVPKP
jgi:hypothetical protein